MSDIPIIVSITSLPSRIGRIRPCLKSLLCGSLVPHKILLALPKYSERERAAYVLPDFLQDRDFGGQIIEVIHADRDWGPGTKLLGVVNAIPRPCYHILADDDVRYKPKFLEGIIDAQKDDHASSFSYYTYRLDGLTVGQGCDGFSFWAPNVAGILQFAEKHVIGTNLFFHDDFWISFYLASKGISIKSLGENLNGGLVYDAEYTDENSLRFLDGPLFRNTLHREGLRRLLRDVDMPKDTRSGLQASFAFSRFVAQPHNRVMRKLKKVLSSR